MEKQAEGAVVSIWVEFAQIFLRDCLVAYGWGLVPSGVHPRGAQTRIKGGDVSCPYSLGLPSHNGLSGIDLNVHCFPIWVYKGHFCYAVWRQNIDFLHCRKYLKNEYVQKRSTSVGNRKQ